MEPQASLPWLTLTMTPGIAARLSALRASLTALDLPAAVAQSLFKKQTFWRAEKEVAAIRRIGCRVVHWHEPEYPQPLLQICDAPVMLYVRGDAAILNSPSIGIVGTRRPTGVDAIAHEGTAAVGGRAIGVLETGIDVCYPKENTRSCTKWHWNEARLSANCRPGRTRRPKIFLFATASLRECRSAC